MYEVDDAKNKNVGPTVCVRFEEFAIKLREEAKAVRKLFTRQGNCVISRM